MKPARKTPPVPRPGADALPPLMRPRRWNLAQGDGAPAPRTPPAHGLARPLRERLATAAHRLRYEAVLEAVGHMGADVHVEEYRDYATCTREVQFAAIRPLPSGTLLVGLAVAPDHDLRLQPCGGRWGSERITAQFELAVHQPIRGWQLGLLRRAYLDALR